MPIFDCSLSKDDDSGSNNGSLGSRKSNSSVGKGKKESDVVEQLIEDEEVEYCGVLCPPEKKTEALKENHAVIEEEYEPFYDSVCADDSDYNSGKRNLGQLILLTLVSHHMSVR